MVLGITDKKYNLRPIIHQGRYGWYVIVVDLYTDSNDDDNTMNQNMTTSYFT